MKNKLLLLIGLFTFSLMNSQVEQYLGAKSALQKSEFIRAVPQESNGYLVMHKDNRVNYWVIDAIQEDEVIKTYQTARGENNVKLEQEVYNNLTYSYKIQGMSETGDTVLDIDIVPANGDPLWIYNGCNRPTCVKTSGSSNYAYGMDVLEHISNDSYKLRLNKAWSHKDSTGIQIPYYIEVSYNNLSAALTDQGHSYVQGESPQTYFFDNGMYKVALGMGVWQSDLGTSTSQINGTGGEGCTLSFGTALNRMNASAPLSTTLECTGQQFSQNQSGGGDNPFGIGNYANASVNILDCSALFSNLNSTYSYHWEEVTNLEGIVSYVLVLTLISTNVDIDCDETTTSNSPCPPGYYYSPGGGDPCKPIEPILENLEKISFIPYDVPSEGEVDAIQEGLYLMVLNYADDITIPIYKKFESRIPLIEDRTNNINELTLFPNPINDELTLSLNQEENIVSYVIFDHLGNEVKKGNFFSKSNEQILDLNELGKGIYFLNIETDSKRYSEKIIKQ